MARTTSSTVTFRLALRCDLSEVAPARLAVRGFLEAQRLPQRELGACELALVEACNNAIQYVSKDGRQQPVAVTVRCNGLRVELRVDDHTPGFEWPERARLPRRNRESGRGLFFIQLLMDRASYARGRGENRLTMRIQRQRQKTRTPITAHQSYGPNMSHPTHPPTS
jgi:anti-sigma regulatory factor (Ser/Thr protein kinase)